MKLKSIILAVSLATSATAFAQSASSYQAPTTTFVPDTAAVLPGFVAPQANAQYDAVAREAFKTYANGVFGALMTTFGQVGTAVKIYNAQNNYDTERNARIDGYFDALRNNVTSANQQMNDVANLLGNRTSITGINKGEWTMQYGTNSSLSRPSTSLYTKGDVIEGATKSQYTGQLFMAQNTQNRQIVLTDTVVFKNAVIPADVNPFTPRAETTPAVTPATPSAPSVGTISQ